MTFLPILLAGSWVSLDYIVAVFLWEFVIDGKIWLNIIPKSFKIILVSNLLNLL